MTTTENEKKIDGVTPTAPASPAPGDDEDAVEFEALINEIAELRDGDTEVEHMDVETYRKGRRS